MQYKPTAHVMILLHFSALVIHFLYITINLSAFDEIISFVSKICIYLKYIYFIISIIKIYKHIYWYIAQDLLTLK